MPLVAKVWERLNLIAILSREPQCGHVQGSGGNRASSGGRIGDGVANHVIRYAMKADN